MQGKHIVFLDQYGSLGGGQQVLLELVRAARSLGHEVTVSLPAGPCADKLRAMGAAVVIAPAPTFTQGKKTIFDILKLLFWNFFVFAINLRLFWHCDLIYINGLRLLPVAMLAERLLGRKAACHVHLNHGPRELELIRCFLHHPLTQAVVVPSPFIQRQLVAFDTVFADFRVKLVENGLDARFANVPYEDRFSGKELRHVAIVGRVSHEKGQDILPDLAKSFPFLVFHVFGDAAFSDQEFMNNLKQSCPKNVIWHGWVNEIHERINSYGIQIVLVPSRVPEAAPLVPLQMAILSCLVIVRKLGALTDIADKYELITFEKDMEITVHIKKIISGEIRISNLCKRTYKKIAKEKNFEKFSSSISQQIETILN